MRYAVIPTRNRPDDLRACLDSLHGQVDYAIVIDNGSEPPLMGRDYKYQSMAVLVIRDSEQPPNLSRLWNVGIAATQNLEPRSGAEGLGTWFSDDNYFVAIVNDDTIIPEGWVNKVINAMDATNASAGCTTPHVTYQQLHAGPPRSAFDRMVGWAFVLRGEDEITANEDLRWWYGDNDLDMKARAKGGTVLIPGPAPLNRYANLSTTGVLAEQAGKDRATFEAIYGPVPW